MHSFSTGINIQLFGPPKITNSIGEEVTPRGQKACALLAMLALAPDYKRSRKWIQDKLWSDRGEEQGAASLRQTLTEIRRALGEHRDCIESDRMLVGFNKMLVTVEKQSKQHISNNSEVVFLEGIEVRDPEFENWLRDQRSYYYEKGKLLREDINRISISKIETESENLPTANLVLLKDKKEDTSDNSILADTLSDTVAQLAAEAGAVEVLDWRTYCDPQEKIASFDKRNTTLAIQTEFRQNAGRSACRLLVFDPATNRMVWSTSISSIDGGLDLDYQIFNNTDLLRSLNVAASKVVDELHRSAFNERRSAQQLCFAGIKHLFRLKENNLKVSDDLFAEAHNLNPSGIYLAWRAYLRTFLIAERRCECELTTSEEALSLAREALELDSHNSFVLSLCAHVYSITQSSPIAAHELALRSIEINSANPMGWICLAVTESQIGDVKRAFSYAIRARKIAGTTPFRYHIDTLGCIVGVLAGEIDQAQHLGEASHSMAPEFAAPLRFLSGIYFHKNREDLAEMMLTRLSSLEDDFSIELLHEDGYPCESLRRSSLIGSIPKSFSYTKA